MIPRLLQQRPDAGVLERDRRALRIMLVIRVRELTRRRDLYPLRRQRLDLPKRPCTLRSQNLSDHNRW